MGRYWTRIAVVAAAMGLGGCAHCWHGWHDVHAHHGHGGHHGHHGAHGEAGHHAAPAVEARTWDIPVIGDCTDARCQELADGRRR